MKKILKGLLVLSLVVCLCSCKTNCEHTFDEWVVTTAATCTVDGVKERVCSLCGTKETGVVEKTGHNYQWVDVDNDTCEEVCINCDDVKTEAQAHTWDDGVQGLGQKVFTCSHCSKTKTEESEVYVSEGFYGMDSLKAGDITSRMILANGIYLNAGSNKFTVEANEKTFNRVNEGPSVTSVNRLKGNGTSKSGGERTIEVLMEKAGTIYVYSMTSSSSDLARQLGLYNDKNMVGSNDTAMLVSAKYTVGDAVEVKGLHVVEGGRYYVGMTGNASNFYGIEVVYDECAHNFGDPTITEEATCGVPGTHTYTCSKCSETWVLKDIPATGEHTFEESFTSKDGSHWHKCSVCGAMKEEAKVPCTIDETLTTDDGEANAENPISYYHYTCSVCGGKWNVVKDKFVQKPSNQTIIMDASILSNQDSVTDLKISDNCHYIVTSQSGGSVKIATAKPIESVTTFELGKLDSVDDFKKYILVTGLTAGDVLIVECNATGGGKSLVFDSNTAELISVPKNADEQNVIKHVVTESEATNGIKIAALGGSVYISSIIWEKSLAEGFYNFNSEEKREITSAVEFVPGIYFKGGSSNKLTIESNSKTFDVEGSSESFSAKNRFKFNGSASSIGERSVEIDMAKAGTIYLYAISGSSSDTSRYFIVVNDSTLIGSTDDNLVSQNQSISGSTVTKVAIEAKAAGPYYISASNGINIYGIQIVYSK